MGIPKITGFLIAVVWIGFFASAFGVYLADMTGSYGVNDSGLDSSWRSTYDKLDDLRGKVEKYDEETEIDLDEGVIDILGGFLSGGYQALVTAKDSFGLFFTMVTDTMGKDNFNLGIAGESLKSAIILTMSILLIFGVLVSFIGKKDI